MKTKCNMIPSELFEGIRLNDGIIVNLETGQLYKGAKEVNEVEAYAEEYAPTFLPTGEAVYPGIRKAKTVSQFRGIIETDR